MAQVQSGGIFVGRDRELAELVAALETAAAGRGRLVLLGGAPGIGKSRLADEIATRARAAGQLVLSGRAWEDAGAPPYWPWVQALRTYLRNTDPADVRRHLASGARDVAQMLPEVRELVPDIPPAPDTSSDSARFQLFDSTATLLRNASRDRPIVLILEDLHAADTPSILLLRFLASQLSEMAVMVLANYRDIVLTPDHPLTAALGELPRDSNTRRIALAGLDVEAVGQVMAATAERSLPDSVVAAVWRESGGNPLFVGETVRLLAAEGRFADGVDATAVRVLVPASVRAVIGRRIDRLDAAIVRTLTNAVALGPEFSIDLLRAIHEQPEPALADHVDAAVAAGLLLPLTGAPGRFRFAHDLIRESLYEELPPGRRVRLHRRITDILEQRYAAGADGHLAELAFHAVAGAADDGRDDAHAAAAIRSRATEYARRAGDQAAAALAFEEAARLYGSAMALVDDDADASPRTIELLLALGEALARSGDTPAAGATYLRAADRSRRAGLPRALARAAIGYGGRFSWTRPGFDTRLIPLLEDALATLGTADPEMRLRLLTRLACAWRSSPHRRADSDRLSAEAVEIARRLGDPASLSYALVGRFWATWWPENPEERRKGAREIVEIAEDLGDGERLVDAHVMQWLVLFDDGRLDAARRELERVGRLARELRQPAQLWLGTAPRTIFALLEGDYALAESLIPEEIPPGSADTLARDALSAYRMHRFLLRREQGRLAEEEPTVRASAMEFPWYPLHRAALACLLLDLGRRDEARTIFEAVAVNDFEAIYHDSQWLLGIALASETCWLLADAATAPSLVRQLEPYAGRNAVGHIEGSVGVMDRYLGLAAATAGQLDDAVRHLRDAIRINERLGARPWTAHTQADLARVLRRRGGPGDAAEADVLDQAALATASALGMALARSLAAGGTTAAPSTAPERASPAAVTQAAVFRLEGEYWTIRFGGGEAIRIRDARGMRHLARLLESPGREIHALELAQGDAAPREHVPALAESDLASDAFGGVGPVLDPEAKAAYRARLMELREDLQEAEAWNDPERAARAQAEIDALAHELTAAVGLGGRDRATGTPAERARVSVTRAIRAAIARIDEGDRALGAHLDATIRTGTFCSYVPDPRAPIRWEL